MEPVTRDDVKLGAAYRLHRGRVLVGHLATICEMEKQREPFTWRETGIEAINHDLSVSDRLRLLDALYADVEAILQELIDDSAEVPQQ